MGTTLALTAAHAEQSRDTVCDQVHEESCARVHATSWIKMETSGVLSEKCFRIIYPFDYPVLAYVVLALTFLARSSVAINWGMLVDFHYDFLILKLGVACALVFVPIEYFKRQMRRRQSLACLLRDCWSSQQVQSWCTWVRWYEFFRILLAVKVCLLAHTSLKQAIPLINPHLFDGLLWTTDRWVHAGSLPVYWSLRAFSAPPVARSLDMLYVFWYGLKCLFLVYFAFAARRDRRWHFFTCYVLLWMIGGCFAIVLPSLGPIYTNPELFANLNTPAAHELQQMLWSHYQQSLAEPASYAGFIYEGIAAFPSLHVGIAALFVFFAAGRRWVFWSLLAYAVAVQVGSVFLGWHYAVDGYFAAGLAGIIYVSTRRLFPSELPAECSGGRPTG